MLAPVYIGLCQVWANWKQAALGASIQYDNQNHKSHYHSFPLFSHVSQCWFVSKTSKKIMVLDLLGNVQIQFGNIELEVKTEMSGLEAMQPCKLL